MVRALRTVIRAEVWGKTLNETGTYGLTGAVVFASEVKRQLACPTLGNLLMRSGKHHRKTFDSLMDPTSSVTPPAPRPRSINLLGTPISSGNQGVIALGAAAASLIAGADPKAEIRLLILHPKPVAFEFETAGGKRRVPVINARLAPRSRPSEHLAVILLLAGMHRLLPLSPLRAAIRRVCPWLQAVAEAEFTGDIRGGDSFSDLYGWRRFLTGFVMAWIVLLMGGRLVQLPQTYGPYRHPLARVLAGYLLRRSHTVIARDEASFAVARALAPDHPRLSRSPDVAFSLHASPPTRDLQPPPGTIGINVNGLMYHGGYTRQNMFGLRIDYPRFLQDTIQGLLAASPHEVWLIPHTFAPVGDVESDPEAARRVHAALPAPLRARVRVIEAELDCHQLKGLIARCDFFLGSRMHACIAALSQGVPCVGVAYSMKFKGVFATVGMGDWVLDARELENDAALSAVLECFRTRAARRTGLQLASADARDHLARVFEEFIVPESPEVEARLPHTSLPNHA
jgi:polysaccharide pyruvyl transferase WcaK-like protein